MIKHNGTELVETSNSVGYVRVSAALVDAALRLFLSAPRDQYQPRPIARGLVSFGSSAMSYPRAKRRDNCDSAHTCQVHLDRGWVPYWQRAEWELCGKNAKYVIPGPRPFYVCTRHAKSRTQAVLIAQNGRAERAEGRPQ